MKLFKKVSAVLLALAIIAVMLPQMGNKEVKAADGDGTVTWTAADVIKNKNLQKAAGEDVVGTVDNIPEGYSMQKQQEEVDALKFDEGGLTVALLPQPIRTNSKDSTKITINHWGTNGNAAYLTGTDNARTSASGSAVDGAKAAPTVGTALKINVTSKGTITAVVQGGGTTGTSFKNIQVTSFTSGQTQNGEAVWKTLVNWDNNKKNDVTFEFSAETGKDYYIFINGSKASFKSVTYSKPTEDKVYATVDCLKTLGAAYREPTEGYSNGIRFGAVFNAATVKKVENNALADIDILNDVETGTLVALESTMTDKNITELKLDDSGNPVAGLKVKRTTRLANESGEDASKLLKYSVAIVNIPEDRQEINFVVRPYVISDGVTYYGDQISASWKEIKDKVAAQQ